MSSRGRRLAAKRGSSMGSGHGRGSGRGRSSGRGNADRNNTRYKITPNQVGIINDNSSEYASIMSNTSEKPSRANTVPIQHRNQKKKPNKSTYKEKQQKKRITKWVSNNNNKRAGRNNNAPSKKINMKPADFKVLVEQESAEHFDKKEICNCVFGDECRDPSNADRIHTADIANYVDNVNFPKFINLSKQYYDLVKKYVGTGFFGEGRGLKYCWHTFSSSCRLANNSLCGNVHIECAKTEGDNISYIPDTDNSNKSILEIYKAVAEIYAETLTKMASIAKTMNENGYSFNKKNIVNIKRANEIYKYIEGMLNNNTRDYSWNSEYVDLISKELMSSNHGL